VSYTQLLAVVTRLRFEVSILILPSAWHTILQELSNKLLPKQGDKHQTIKLVWSLGI